MDEPVRLLNYNYPLRPDVSAFLQLPRDITLKEAERLAAMILTLPIPERAPTEEQELREAGVDCREDEAYGAGIMAGTLDAHSQLADVAGRMKAYGYDAETLRVLTEHIFGGAEIPMPVSAPEEEREAYGIPGHCYDINGDEWHAPGECTAPECRKRPCCGYRAPTEEQEQ